MILKNQSDGNIYAKSGKATIGMVVKINATDRWHWHCYGLSRPYGWTSEGETKRKSDAVRSLRNKWGELLKFYGLIDKANVLQVSVGTRIRAIGAGGSASESPPA